MEGFFILVVMLNFDVSLFKYKQLNPYLSGSLRILRSANVKGRCVVRKVLSIMSWWLNSQLLISETLTYPGITLTPCKRALPTASKCWWVTDTGKMIIRLSLRLFEAKNGWEALYQDRFVSECSGVILLHWVILCPEIFCRSYQCLFILSWDCSCHQEGLKWWCFAERGKSRREIKI